MYYHVWFVTKYRKRIIKGKVEIFLKGTFAECIKRHRYHILELGMGLDHVHMLVKAEDRKELAGIMRVLKAVSSREIRKTPYLRLWNAKVFWARKYGCREVERHEITNICKYIKNQGKRRNA